MLISRKQIVSPWQYEVIDETGNVLSSHDRPEDAQAAIDEVDRSKKSKVSNDNRSTRPIPRTETSLFPAMPTSITEVIATAKELKQQQKREG